MIILIDFTLAWINHTKDSLLPWYPSHRAYPYRKIRDQLFAKGFVDAEQFTAPMIASAKAEGRALTLRNAMTNLCWRTIKSRNVDTLCIMSDWLTQPIKNMIHFSLDAGKQITLCIPRFKKLISLRGDLKGLDYQDIEDYLQTALYDKYIEMSEEYNLTTPVKDVFNHLTTLIEEINCDLPDLEEMIEICNNFCPLYSMDFDPRFEVSIGKERKPDFGHGSCNTETRWSWESITYIQAMFSQLLYYMQNGFETDFVWADIETASYSESSQDGVVIDNITQRPITRREAETAGLVWRLRKDID